MDSSLDDLLQEAEGALKEGAPDHRSVRPCRGQQHHHHRTVEAFVAAAGMASTAGAAPTPPAKATSAKTTAPTISTIPSSIADDFDSDSEYAPGITIAVAEGSGIGVDSKSHLGEAAMVPVLAKHDDGFDARFPPALETVPVTTAIDVNSDLDSAPARFSVVASTGTAADVDFDSDSSPELPAVMPATGSAADIDFDSDSSAERPVPVAAAGVIRVDFDLDSQAPTEERGANNNGQVEELLRLASEVEEGEEGATSSTSTSLPTTNSRVRTTRSDPLQQGGQETGDENGDFLPAVNTTLGLQASTHNGEAVASSARKRRRCGIVCLGGATEDKGFCASSLSQRACDNLRCIDCNFEVLRFDAQAWDESITDYMFLRNNAPDPVKLGARLRDSPGTCAYACQCFWQNVEELRVLSPTERPRWACGGHD